MASKRIVVLGGTGFLGRRIVARLVERGDTVTVLSRSGGTGRAASSPRAAAGAAGPAGAATPTGAVVPRVVAYDPAEAGPWLDEVISADAVVHVAGEPVVGVRWTAANRRAFERSRVTSSEHVARALAAAPRTAAGRVLVGGSAVGYYGMHGPEVVLDESSPAGSDYLAGLTVRWEGAQAEARTGGVRVAHVRTGIVLGRGGGVLGQMAPLFRFFVGGPIGSGRQMVSWVHEHDLVSLFLLAIDDARVDGAINATAPNPASMDELAGAIGAALGRPSWLRVPSFAPRLLFGEGAEPILRGQRVVPRLAEKLGFTFRHPEIRQAVADVLAG